MAEQSWVERRVGVAPTSPPLDRRAAASVLDEEGRPTAAEPAAHVRFPLPSAAHHLVQIHDHYRAELARVRDVLARVAAGVADVGEARGELQTMTLRANAWTVGGLCQQQCHAITAHHLLEDQALYPHLRRAQPDLVAVLARLHEEHVAITEVLEAVDRSLVGLAQDPAAIGPVVEAVDLLSDTVLSHFAYEERELLGPLARFGMT